MSDASNLSTRTLELFTNKLWSMEGFNARPITSGQSACGEQSGRDVGYKQVRRRGFILKVD